MDKKPRLGSDPLEWIRDIRTIPRTGNLKVGIVALGLVALITGGCARHYTWTSDTGRQCFYQCQAQRHQCRAYCWGDLSCNLSCNNMERSCMASCPDLIRDR